MANQKTACPEFCRDWSAHQWCLRAGINRDFRAIIVVILQATLVFAANETTATEKTNGIDLAKLDHWDIVVAEEAIASEQYAAEEFQDFFQQASGVRLPIVNETERSDRHVFIGPGQPLHASNVGFSIEGFGEEDHRIVLRDGNLAIAGGRPRGTLYGVYTFLEDYLGVRFLTQYHTHVPPVGEVHLIAPVDRYYHPPLAFRWSFYHETNAAPAFAARTRCNTVPESDRLGGRTSIDLINHSFLYHCPVGKYGDRNPEYFALVDGERTLGAEAQLCLSNPEVLRVVIESVLQQLHNNSRAKNISVSPNDNWGYCCCKNCAALDRDEAGQMGSLLRFVNAVADRVAHDHPQVKVGTLAYAYHRKRPATVRPRPNVMIQLCSIECCVMHAIDDPDCPLNVRFCQDMAEWGAVSDDIFIWSYNSNNYLLPFPNFRVIEPNIRYFVAHQARGIFMQVAYTSAAAELSDLRNYVTAGLLWDPQRSGQQLIDEFLDLHYGLSATPIRRFLKLVHDRAAASGLHRNCFGRGVDYAIDESTAQAGLAAFDQALEIAENEQIRRRIEKASICACRAAIEPIWYVEDPVPERPAPGNGTVISRRRMSTRNWWNECDHLYSDLSNSAINMK